LKTSEHQQSGHRHGKAQKRPKQNAAIYSINSLGCSLKSFLPQLMKTEAIAMKSATEAQAITHVGIPDSALSLPGTGA